MIDGSGCGEHHVRGLIMGAEIALEMGGLETLDAVLRAEDRPTGGLVRKRGCLHQVEHHVLRRVLRRGDFLKNHVSLACKLAAVETRGKNDVAQDVEGKPEILTQHACVIRRRVDSGRGVELAANRLDLLGDVLRASPGGALEGHVLEEVSDAVLGQALAAASRADPDAERHGLDVGSSMAHYGEAIGQSGNRDTHAPTSVRTRARSAMKVAMALASLDSTVMRSASPSLALSLSGCCGLRPVARSIASGNFAG